MRKYEPLRKYLSQQVRPHLPMTFGEIERILGQKLPPSKGHRAWWSNNPTNNVMTKEWLEAGYETESVDIASEKLVFRRVQIFVSKKDNSPQGEGGDVLKDPIFGCMKGTMTIPDDLDLTAPVDVEWSKVYEDE